MGEGARRDVVKGLSGDRNAARTATLFDHFFSRSWALLREYCRQRIGLSSNHTIRASSGNWGRGRACAESSAGSIARFQHFQHLTQKNILRPVTRAAWRCKAERVPYRISL